MQSRVVLLLVAAACLLFLETGVARALPLFPDGPPSAELCLAGGASCSGRLNPLGTTNTVSGTPIWSLTNPYVATDLYTINSWTTALDIDPFVTNNINVTNTSGVTQTFVATVLLPISAFSYNAVKSSSVGVTVTDSNGDGALSFSNFGATPIYQGTVNVTTTLLALNPATPVAVPLTLASCPIPFPGCTATSSNGVAYLAVAPGSATNIGITLTFNLSPGDSAGLTSRFEIVPEPTTLVLLGSGVIGLVGFGRRRTA